MEAFKFDVIILITTLFLTSYPVGLSASTNRSSSSDRPITVVSDTTDDDNTEEAVLDTVYEDQAGGKTLPSWLNRFGCNMHNNSLLTALGLSGIALTLLIIAITVFIHLLPVLFILLAIWLIVKHRRKKSTAEPYRLRQAQSEADDVGMKLPASSYEIINKRKDKAILHIAWGTGIILFFLIIYIKTGIAAGCVLLCCGIGEYVNAKREERRNDNDSH